VSLVGTWMQTVALGWLVLELTGSGTALGTVVAAQFLPILLLGPYGGLLADRMDKRRLLMATQAVLAATALALGLLVVTGAVELWMVVAVAVVFGLVTACDTPTRQAFSLEMVGPERLRNAVSLHSTLVNVARAVGPAVAGLVIATAGTGICFLINAGSYAAVLAALWTMETGTLRPARPAVREPGQVREGIRYVGRTPGLLVPLIMVALIGTLAYEFQVVLPLLATGPFHGDAATYGVLTSAMGAGAIVGGLVVAGHGRTGLRPLTAAAAVFGAAILAIALSPSLPVAVLALAATGAASITFLATGNTTLQLASEPRFRGRVMALWTVAFLGSTPIGAPIVGAISEHLGPRGGLAAGAATCHVAAAVGALALAREGRAPAGPGRGEAQPVP
jgi:MFS family permease